ncbi:hypothetical protein LguiB_029743 [Lonicera macranthoides]
MRDEVDGSHLNTLSSSPISTSDGTSWPPIQRRYLTMAPIGSWNPLVLFGGVPIGWGDRKVEVRGRSIE